MADKKGRVVVGSGNGWQKLEIYVWLVWASSIPPPPPIRGFIDAFLLRKTKEGEGEEERKERGLWGYTRLVSLLLCFLLLVLIIDGSLRFDLSKTWIDTD